MFGLAANLVVEFLENPERQKGNEWGR
jgi:hypothetical protein